MVRTSIGLQEKRRSFRGRSDKEPLTPTAGVQLELDAAVDRVFAHGRGDGKGRKIRTREKGNVRN